MYVLYEKDNVYVVRERERDRQIERESVCDCHSCRTHIYEINF